MKSKQSKTNSGRKQKSQARLRFSELLAALVQNWKATGKKWRTMTRKPPEPVFMSNNEMMAKAETLDLCARELERLIAANDRSETPPTAGVRKPEPE